MLPTVARRVRLRVASVNGPSTRRFMLGTSGCSIPRTPRTAGSPQLRLMASSSGIEGTTATSSDLQSQYQYQSLPDDQTIRILTLQPAKHADAPLIGTLTVENLRDEPSYEAISYAWGSERRAYGLCLDGAVLPLTRSIHDALQRLRLSDHPRHLWADQICINQSDVSERSRQVRLMNVIYRGARHVLVWLGRDEEGFAPDAAAMIERLSSIFSDEEKMEEFRQKHLYGLGEVNGQDWLCLSKLTKLPWFNRLWIVQEIGTGNDATLFWGSASVPWTTLSNVAAVLNQDFHHLRARFQIYTPNIRYLWNRFVPPDEGYDEFHNRGNFIYELHRARHLLTKDPRDHVYAFLGHYSISSGAGGLRDLVPDYTRSVDEVYTDVAVRDLRGSKTLLLLSACQKTITSSRAVRGVRYQLPSWVPDWRAMPMQIIGVPKTPHRATGDTLPQLSVDPKGCTLTISGVRIDTVACHSWTFHNQAFEMRAATFPHKSASGPQLPLERLWSDICGFGDADFSLEHRYRAGKSEDSAFFALAQTITNACTGIDRSRPYEDIPAREWLAHAAAYLLSRSIQLARPISPSLQDLAGEGDAFRWSREATLVSRYRKLAVTSREGYYVLGPEALRNGDALVLLHGGRTPFILRKHGRARWALIGECYVHGLMAGEGLEGQDGNIEQFEIE